MKDPSGYTHFILKLPDIGVLESWTSAGRDTTTVDVVVVLTTSIAEVDAPVINLSREMVYSFSATKL